MANDEIEIKVIGKRFLNIFKNLKKTFTLLLIFILIISALLFIKVIFNPNYSCDVLLKSKYVSKDQITIIIDKFNVLIEDDITNDLDTNIVSTLKNSSITKFEVSEVEVPPFKLSLNPQRPETYRLEIHYSLKPTNNNIKNINTILDYIKELSLIDNDIVERKKYVEEAIIESDSLVKVSFDIANALKTKINQSNNFLVSNDISKSINDILGRKFELKKELFNLSKENIIYKTSPIKIYKNINKPIIIFIIGFVVWLGLCLIISFFIFIFNDKY